MKEKLQFSAAMGIFGTIALFVREIPASSATVALLRAVIAAAFLLILGAATGKPVRFGRLGKDALPLVLSGAAMGFNWILLFEAYKYTTVSVATLCYYFAPTLFTVASIALFRERLSALQAACFVGATAGLALVVGFDASSGANPTLGVLLALGAAVLYATVMLLNKRIQSVGGVDRTVLQFLSAVVVLTPYLLLTEGIHLENVRLTGGLCIAAVGLIHTGLAYVLYFSALPKLRSQEAATLSYIDPLVAVAVSFFLLKEPAGALQLIGGAMILGFTLLNELSPKAK